MLIRDKDKFLKAMLDLFDSVDAISCTDTSSAMDEDFVHATTEAFINAYVEYVLSKGDLRSEAYVNQTESWVREWVYNGPIFIMFNVPGLMEEVNTYLVEHKEVVNADNESTVN
jgi:hypothetical protein